MIEKCTLIIKKKMQLQHFQLKNNSMYALKEILLRRKIFVLSNVLMF